MNAVIGVNLLLIVLANFNFFVLSDLHYDVAYMNNYDKNSFCHSVSQLNFLEEPHITDDLKPMGRYHCDSPFELIEESIRKMTEIDNDPEFILILGDVLAHFTMELLDSKHEIDRSKNKILVKNTYRGVEDLFRKHFKNSKIIYVFGNNDGYEDYYDLSKEEAEDYLAYVHDV